MKAKLLALKNAIKHYASHRGENAELNRQSKFLPDMTVLEEQESKRLIIIVMALLTALVIFLLLWAALTHVDEVVIASGEVTPQTKIQVAQHLEGGVISKVLVSNGEQVKAGDLLLELEPTANQADLAEYQAKLFSLKLKAARLNALLMNDPENFEKSIHNLSLNKSHQQVIDEERQLLHSERADLQGQLAVLRSQHDQVKTSLLMLEEQRSVAVEQVRLLEKEIKISESLLNDQLVSEGDYLRISRELNQAKGDHKKLLGEIMKSNKQLIETNLNITSLEATFKKKNHDLLAETLSELARYESVISKFQDRVDKLKITAPEDGIIKGFESDVGRVVKSGETLLEIVPQHTFMQVEVRIPANEIGHVKLGDKVKVKISTYDFARYGAISGQLKSLSPATFKTEDNNDYYKAMIMLHQQYVGQGTDKHNLLPGMKVQADIRTGNKTILQYLLKPIHVTMSHSFQER